MTDMVFGVLVGLAIALLAVLAARPWRGRAFAEPRGYLHPEPPATPGPGGRTCAAGGGAAEVWSAPAPVASPTTTTALRRGGGRGLTAAPVCSPPAGRARHAVGTSGAPLADVPTAPRSTS
ncbi:hypothetical protein [Saccharothrix sp. HUAS TT1]|uniref:hypothetical protein n=1 Tax=unclassified Saccharothrix TaxID=2593673 RepID=UPI00345BDDA5